MALSPRKLSQIRYSNSWCVLPISTPERRVVLTSFFPLVYRSTAAISASGSIPKTLMDRVPLGIQSLPIFRPRRFDSCVLFKRWRTWSCRPRCVKHRIVEKVGRGKAQTLLCGLSGTLRKLARPRWTVALSALVRSRLLVDTFTPSVGSHS